MHNRKIMELQQKYKEDLEDIGEAHALAALQPDADAIIEEERKKDRAVALKRGKEAIERMIEAGQVMRTIIIKIYFYLNIHYFSCLQFFFPRIAQRPRIKKDYIKCGKWKIRELQ